ncbi:MAG: hypothetical protein QM775_20585 [Pirellulales bacterium]
MQRNDYQTAHSEVASLPAELRYRPLAHFVRPIDPCVPKQLLGQTLEEVAKLSFDDLTRFPGVGPVKIANLTTVLQRIVSEPGGPIPEQEAPPESAAATPLWNEIPSPPISTLTANKPTEVYAQVDELLWEHWCQRIRRHGLGRETLGRCVARLRDLPRSLWFVPVEDFLYVAYNELFQLRGFGVKRVAAIVEVFRALDAAITVAEQAEAETGSPAVPVACPPIVAQVDAAVSAVVIGRFAWRAAWFEQTVIQPLWEQLQIDGDETTCAWWPSDSDAIWGRCRLTSACVSWGCRARIVLESWRKPPLWCTLAGRSEKSSSASCCKSLSRSQTEIRP